jgi:hypothetical protein
VVPKTVNPQFRKYPDGRQQVAYTVDVEYPAESVLRYIKAKLHQEGWKPLRHDFLNPGSPSSLVRGWQESEDETPKPSVVVRGWGANKLRVIVLYMPANVAR